MKLTIIERFEIEGRGTVFFASLDSYNGENLIGEKFSHKGEMFLIRDVEFMRGGFVALPNQKKRVGLLVRKIS